MIVEAAMLVIGDDEQTVLPERRSAESFIRLLNEELPRFDAAERVMRVAVRELRKRVVARLDEGVRRVVGRRGDVRREILVEIVDVEGSADPLEHGDVRETVAAVDPVLEAGILQPVEDRSLLERNTRPRGREGLDILLVRRCFIEEARP